VNKRYYLFFLAILFALITACSDDKPNEDVFSDVAEHKDKVNNYEIEIDLQVVITNDETEEVLQSSQALMDSTLFEDTNNSHGTLKSINDDIEEIIEYYHVDNEAYANIDDQGWEVLPEDNEIITDDDSTYYKAIADLVEEIKDEVDLETDGDHYVLTFQGKSETIYDAFEDPYSLTLSGVTPADVEHDVEIKINQDTMLVEHIKNTITGTNDGLKLELAIDHTYDKINEVDDITISQDVLDEAN